MYSVVDMEFKDWLNQVLIEKGWSQSDLARAAGLQRGTVSNLLNNVRQPGAEICKSLSEALDIELITVYEKAGLLPKSPPETEQQRQLVYLFNQLPDDEKQRLVEYAGFLKSQHDKK